MGMFGVFCKKDSDMNWKPLETIAQIDGILKDSYTKPQLIFKHSTRCNVSRMVLVRFEREWNLDGKAVPWLLDLLCCRDVSDAVAEQLDVVHESPQVILVCNGSVAYHGSHHFITVQDIANVLS